MSCMIIHNAPDFQIYFGDIKDQMFPDEYLSWNTGSLLSHAPIKRVADTLRLQDLFFLRQMHGMHGHVISADNKQTLQPFSTEGDFLITNQSRLGIGVVTADCLPVVAYDKKNHAVGVAHAGWRGAVAGVASQMILHLMQTYGTDLHDLIIYFGPSAKRCCYEVDAQFMQHLEPYPFHEQLLQQHGNALFFDLPLLVEQQLIGLGISTQSIHQEYNTCTICDTRFHSYRRGASLGPSNRTGRQMTVVALK